MVQRAASRSYAMGRRVITTTGMSIVGFFFYLALIALLVIWASRP